MKRWYGMQHEFVIKQTWAHKLKKLTRKRTANNILFFLVLILLLFIKKKKSWLIQNSAKRYVNYAQVTIHFFEYTQTPAEICWEQLIYI